MIALDTSAIICLVERIEPARTRIAELLLADGRPVIMSSVAMTECLSSPLARDDIELIAEYTRFFDSAETRVDFVTSNVAFHAARLRATFDLKTVDALHLATAIEAGASTFITTDRKDFTKCVGQVGLEILILLRRA